jgi:hypothetical protein
MILYGVAGLSTPVRILLQRARERAMIDAAAGVSPLLARFCECHRVLEKGG